MSWHCFGRDLGSWELGFLKAVRCAAAHTNVLPRAVNWEFIVPVSLMSQGHPDGYRTQTEKIDLGAR